MEDFRLIFELLWPDAALDGGNADLNLLVDFLRSQGINKWGDLGGKWKDIPLSAITESEHFRPLSEVLWPGVPTFPRKDFFQRNLKPYNLQELLDYDSITTMGALEKWEEHMHEVDEDLEDWELAVNKLFELRPSYMDRLNHIATYLEGYGEKSFLKLVSDRKAQNDSRSLHTSILNEIQDYSDLYFRYGNYGGDKEKRGDYALSRYCSLEKAREILSIHLNKLLNRFPNDREIPEKYKHDFVSFLPKDLSLQDLSLGQAREILQSRLDNIDIWGLAGNPGHISKKFRFCDIVLPLLDRFPQLASERYSTAVDYWSRGQRWYPYCIFLVCGCREEILERVYAHHPIPIQDIHQSADWMISDMMRRFWNYREGWLPSQTILLLVKRHPELLATRHDGMLLLELVFFFGYDMRLLEQLFENIPNEITRFLLRPEIHFRKGQCYYNRQAISDMSNQLQWEMDSPHLELIEKIIPQLTHLTIDPPDWEDADSFRHVVKLVTKQGPSSASKLEVLELSLPGLPYGCHKVGGRTSGDVPSSVFEELLLKKNLSLKDIGFRYRGFGDQQHYLQSLVGALRKLKESDQASDWQLEKLTLKTLINESSIPLLLELLSQEGIRGLEFCDQDEESEWHCPCPWDKQKNSPSGTTVIDALSIQGVEMPADGWSAVWNKILTMATLENLHIAPPSFFRLDGHARLPRLTRFSLGIGYYLIRHSMSASDHSRKDITEMLVSVLNNSPLESLQVERNGENRNLSAFSYSVQVQDIFQAVGNSRTLKSFKLLGLPLVPEPNKAVSRSVLDILEPSNHKVLQEVEVFDTKLYYTLIPPGNIRGASHEIECYETARKTHYWVCLNRAGRGKLQDTENTKMEDVVQLLMNVGLSIIPLDEFTRSIVARASPQDSVEGDDDALDQIYGVIRESPDLLAKSLERSVNITGIVYGLLHESPTIWCGGSIISDSPPCEPTQKRRRLE